MSKPTHWDKPRWVEECYDGDKLDLARFLPLWAMYAIMNQRGISQGDLAKCLVVTREAVSLMFIRAASKKLEVAEKNLMALDAAITAFTDKEIKHSGYSRKDGLTRLFTSFTLGADGAGNPLLYPGKKNARWDADLEAWPK